MRFILARSSVPPPPSTLSCLAALISSSERDRSNFPHNSLVFILVDRYSVGNYKGEADPSISDCGPETFKMRRFATERAKRLLVGSFRSSPPLFSAPLCSSASAAAAAMDSVASPVALDTINHKVGFFIYFDHQCLIESFASFVCWFRLCSSHTFRAGFVKSYFLLFLYSLLTARRRYLVNLWIWLSIWPLWLFSYLVLLVDGLYCFASAGCVLLVYSFIQKRYLLSVTHLIYIFFSSVMSSLKQFGRKNMNVICVPHLVKVFLIYFYLLRLFFFFISSVVQENFVLTP